MQNDSIQEKKISEGLEESMATSAQDTLWQCLEVLGPQLARGGVAPDLWPLLPPGRAMLTPEFLVRSAPRVGLRVKMKRASLQQIARAKVPAILVLAGGQYGVVAHLNAQEVQLIMPPNTGETITMTRTQLSRLYTGTVIYVQRRRKGLWRGRVDTRATAAPKPPRGTASGNAATWFWGTLRQFWVVYVQVVLAALFLNSLAIVVPVFAMNAYDRLVPYGEPARETFFMLGVGVLIVFSFDFLFRVLRAYLVDSAGKKADIVLARRIFQHTLRLQLSARPVSAGYFANQLGEYEALRDFFSAVVLVSLIDLPFVFLFIGGIYVIGGPIAYIPLIALPVIATLSFCLQVPLHAALVRMSRASSEKQAVLLEAINGLETVKSLGVESHIQRHWEQFVTQCASATQSVKQMSVLAVSFTAYIHHVCTVVVLMVGVWQVFQGRMTMGALIACTILTGRALAPLERIAQLLTRLTQASTALHSLNHILHLPLERTGSKSLQLDAPLQGKIEFQDVHFHYPGQQVRALEGLSVKIAPGEKVGVIGRVGSGKSTLGKLVLGLYEADAGAVYVDDGDVMSIDPSYLRAHIGYVPQDVFLFAGSVRDNIMMAAPDATSAQMIQAAAIAGVDAFVDAHPLGYDMPVGEGGRGVSGGQRQAIAIARALLKNPPILLFDEPTAMLDYASEAQFLKKMTTQMAAKTLVLVTHRMPLLALVERVIVVDGGRVVADGPRDHILQSLSHAEMSSAQGADDAF